MKILISFINTKGKVQDPNRLVGIFDTENKQFVKWLKLDTLTLSDNISHATGMCYIGHMLYIGLIPLRHRLTSRLLIINTETGDKKIHDLMLTKAIHSICPIPNSNIILACSTQNDLITSISTDNVEVLCEDIYFDLLPDGYRKQIDLTQEYKHDDNYHVNGICINPINNHIIYTSFGNRYKGIPGKLSKNSSLLKGIFTSDGTVYDISDSTVYDINDNKNIIHGLNMPHSPFFNLRNELMFCDSKTFRLINDYCGMHVELDGFTRGVVEDIDCAGYWVGISNFRQYSAKQNKDITFKKKDINLTGARLQFVDYNMQLMDTWDIPEYGNEIFELIEYKEGKYE